MGEKIKLCSKDRQNNIQNLVTESLKPYNIGGLIVIVAARYLLIKIAFNIGKCPTLQNEAGLRGSDHRRVGAGDGRRRRRSYHWGVLRPQLGPVLLFR
jgi:hypothetical protein